MARLFNKLTALQVQRLHAPGKYGDGNGLWLVVAPGGTKSWIFRYDLHGRRREMGLGSIRDVTLAAARLEVQELRGLLRAGQDPLEVIRARAQDSLCARANAMTFDACAAAYIAAHRPGWRNPKHAQQWENTLATYASPVLGHLPVAHVDTALVLRVLQPIWHDKTETATRLRSRIEAILDWATVSQFRSGENPARWKGHLNNLLAKPGKISAAANFPAMPWKQMPAFMAKLRLRTGVSPRALEFAIHTAARSQEVRYASWEEVDLAGRVWVIPSHRMKGQREHWVPLTEPVLELLVSLPHRSGLLFPSPSRARALSDMTLSAVLRRMGYGEVTVHGFRSTFRDWAAEEPGHHFPRELCEHALAHQLPDRVEAAYQRGTMFEKRRGLMAAWSLYLLGHDRSGRSIKAESAYAAS